MTKLTDAQNALRRAIHENPRVLWMLSSAVIATCRNANKNFLSAIIAAKNAQRPVRAYENFTGTLAIDTEALRKSCETLLNALNAVATFSSNISEYVPDFPYTLPESTNYDAAVRDKSMYDVVTSKPWGNFDSGKSLTPVISTYQKFSGYGPFEVAAPITYTVDGTEVQIPASGAYVRSREEPFVFSNFSELKVRTDAGTTSFTFLPATYTADLIVSELDSVGIAAYAENGIVTLTDPDSVEVLASPAAAVLAFPVGTTRTTRPFTDCDDVAKALGASVQKDTLSLDIAISDGKLVSDHDDLIGDCILSLLKFPYGTYLVRDDVVLPYFGTGITAYQGPGWLMKERLVIESPTAFSVSSDGADPLGLVGEAAGTSKVLKDTFSIVPRVGDVIKCTVAGERTQLTITAVRPGVSVTVDETVGDVTDWKLMPKHYMLCEDLKALRTSMSKIYKYLNVDPPQNTAEYTDYLERLSAAEELYKRIRPRLVAASTYSANNDASQSMYAELKASKYDIAADTLARGEISSFFLLNDITASSAKMLSVYRSSL